MIDYKIIWMENSTMGVSRMKIIAIVNDLRMKGGKNQIILSISYLEKHMTRLLGDMT